MANLFDSRIECITNKDLLRIIDPNKIIENTNSEFRFSLVDELVFETRSCTMHEDIVEFSTKFPREVFMVRYYDLCSRMDGDSPGLYVRYENGKFTFLGYEPKYEWENQAPILDNFGLDVYYRLHKRVRQYLMRLDHTKESILTEELECDLLEHHFDDCVRSYVTIYAEFENYKLSVDKSLDPILKLRGYRRESETDDWKEITYESQMQKQQDN